ncbi:MAG: hypothetical protein JJU12_07630 [Chlamydiales bacterium]|nr:hypothetical protein [Chlamydiales bacterium]
MLVKECDRLLSKRDEQTLGKSKDEIRLALLKSIKKVESLAWESKIKPPAASFHLREPIFNFIRERAKEKVCAAYPLIEKLLQDPLVYLCPSSLLNRTIMKMYRALLDSEGGKRIISALALHDNKLSGNRDQLRLAQLRYFQEIVNKGLKTQLKKYSEDHKIFIRGELFSILFELIEKNSSTSLEQIETLLLKRELFLCSNGVLETRIKNTSSSGDQLIKLVLENLKIARRLQIKEHLLKTDNPNWKGIIEEAYGSSLMGIESDNDFLKELSHYLLLHSDSALPEHLDRVIEELKNPQIAQDRKVRLEQLYDRGEVIPESLKTLVPVDKGIHTLDPLEYVGNRLSQTIFKAIEVAKSVDEKEKGVEIFLGSASDLTDYYKTKGYYVHSRLGTDSSNWFSLLVDQSNPKRFKAVISRVANKSRFYQVLHQLKYGGVDLEDVAVRGSLANAMGSIRRSLESKFKKSSMKPHTVYIGARMQVVVQLAHYYFPQEMATVAPEKQGPLAEELLSRYDYKQESIDGVITYSHINAPRKEGRGGIIALRMPNGDLAYEAMRALLNAGAENVVMVGAGGALNKDEGGVGSFHFITESSYEGKQVSIKRESIMPIQVEEIDWKNPKRNVTVDTPLQETIEWKKQAEKEASSVDVETYHILRALDEHKQPIQIVPGLFISDVVGVESLNEKIDDSAALQHLPQLIYSTLDYLGFSPEKEQVFANPHIKNLQSIINRHVEIVKKSKAQVDLALNGDSVEIRLEYSRKLHEVRQQFADKVFLEVVRPQIEELLLHYKEKEFDEIVTIYGFNRLFTQDISSVDTDVDFMLIINTNKGELIREIRRFINLQINPLVKSVGIEMEVADFLVNSKKSYLAGLNTTRSALLTLANLPKQNRRLITGSGALFADLFHFTNEQLAMHFVQLMLKRFPQESFKDYPEFCLDSRMTFVSGYILREKILKVLKKEGETFRIALIDHMVRLACLELNIGKNPYKGRETLQTIMSRASLSEDRKDRSEPLSIELGINRFADIYDSAFLGGIEEITSIIKEKEINYLKELGVTLSNIIYRMKTDGSAAFHLHKKDSGLTLEHLKKMNRADRLIIIRMLEHFKLDVPNGSDFAEKCYDALWKLADLLDGKGKEIENRLYKRAKELLIDVSKRD